MKITQILCSGKPSISFEVFPPKTDDTFESVRDAARHIAALSPAFMSVTYGAGGGTSKYTVDIARDLEATYHVPTLAHLTCVSSTRQTVMDRIDDIRMAGIDNIMALRGDIPDYMQGCDRSSWHYSHASDLIADIRARLGDSVCIGGACYPEVHPESPSRAQDIYYLKQKIDAGCDFLTTQMFFDNSLLYTFLYRIREAGITVPVVAGIMPITNANQVDRAIRLSGSHMPQRFKSIVDRFGNNPAAMKQAGIAYATDQIIDLFANGVNNVHVYSMNKPDVAAGIYNNLSQIIFR